MPNATLSPPPLTAKPQAKAIVSHGPQFDLYGWLVNPKRFIPVYFFIGVLASLILCSVVGRWTAHQNSYENFHRFHPYLNPTSLFYPTASQMVSLVEAKSSPDQTIVILGGNSVFYGLGQPVAELWSDDLQKRLGSKFAVFNFAMPSANAFEGAYWAAESLLKKNRKVIYATVALPVMTGSPAGSDVYGYAFWDAKEKHMLFHDKNRDALIDAQSSILTAKEKQQLDELKLRAKLDSLLYFEDLWTTSGYRNFFTVWTGSTAKNPLKARKDFSDDEKYGVVPTAERFNDHQDLDSVKRYCKAAFDYNTSTLRPSFWQIAVCNMRGLTPDTLKRNCLVVVSTHAPGLIRRLNAVESQRETLGTDTSLKYWRQLGYQSTGLVGVFDDDDFMDARHLLPGGGRKLAAVVAGKVLSMNQQLYPIH